MPQPPRASAGENIATLTSAATKAIAQYLVMNAPPADSYNVTGQVCARRIEKQLQESYVSDM
jgi:hypothetical protein